jgi:hypothetical protein
MNLIFYYIADLKYTKLFSRGWETCGDTDKVPFPRGPWQFRSFTTSKWKSHWLVHMIKRRLSYYFDHGFEICSTALSSFVVCEEKFEHQGGSITVL